MLFKKDNNIIRVTEVSLSKDYAFMYENFIVSSQHKLLLLLEQTADVIDTLQFDSLIYKYGYPNDEVSHPLSKYGLGLYGLFKVTNSPWIIELRDNNRQHSGHTDSSIGYEVRFNSKATFNRVFKKFTDLTPSAYKEKFSSQSGNGFTSKA